MIFALPHHGRTPLTCPLSETIDDARMTKLMLPLLALVQTWFFHLICKLPLYKHELLSHLHRVQRAVITVCKVTWTCLITTTHLVYPVVILVLVFAEVIVLWANLSSSPRPLASPTLPSLILILSWCLKMPPHGITKTTSSRTTLTVHKGARRLGLHSHYMSGKMTLSMVEKCMCRVGYVDRAC